MDNDKIDKGRAEGPETLPEASFGLFISGLMMEGLIAMGEIENPITKKKETDLAHAKFTIDTLAMIKEKTKNKINLDIILIQIKKKEITENL